MSLPTGWICPNGDQELSELRGLRADVLRYFATPHRMLVIRVKEVAGSTEPRFILCTGVLRMEVPPSWLVERLHCSRVDENTLLLEDRQPSMRVQCYALRVFSDAEFKRWLGPDFALVDPSAEEFHSVPQPSVAT